MTAEEVAAVVAVTGQGDAGQGRPVVTALTEIAGHPFVVSHFFDRSRRLAAVEVQPAVSLGDASPVYDEVIEWVSAQSGQPAIRRDGMSPSGSWKRLATWNTPASHVELRAWETVLEDARIVHFQMRTGEAEAADARGFVLTYLPNEPLARGTTIP